jgi:HPr kinase/phosphorylase
MPMLQSPLTIQRLYDDNRDSLQLGWFAGFPGGERQIAGDAASAADQVGHQNLIHPGRIQVFGHQELEILEHISTKTINTK